MSSNKVRLLLVDDESAILDALKRALRNLPLDIDTANDGLMALEQLRSKPADIILSDLSMPNMDGNQLFAEVARLYPETIRIMLTGHTNLDNVLNAINQGKVWGYLQKPWDNKQLAILLEQAMQAQDILAERSLLRRTVERYQVSRKSKFEGFIGDSIEMQFVYNAIERCAPSKASVFITGPSGTGKEVAAEAIHHLSNRKNAPFIALNCAAIPSELMESEIFGHVKGAFSGALANRDGAAAMANGGTLFLDELGEMDIVLQAKILRFVQTGTFQPVGSSKTEKVDVRFICATNRDPIQAIEQQKLREDLYYRLNVISLDLPALKDRDEDMVQIAKHFLHHYAEEEGKIFAGFSSDGECLLRQYHWPGNIRQLQNLIHSCVIMSEGPLLTSQTLGKQLKLDKASTAQLSVQSVGHARSTQVVQEQTETQAAVPPLSQDYKVEPLALVERRAIEKAIDYYGDNVVQAATALGVSPSTLYRKIQQWQSA